MDDPRIALLRDLLAQGKINQAEFDALVPPSATPAPTAAVKGSGANAVGDGAQAVGARGTAIGGNNLGVMQTGNHNQHHTHLHAAPTPPGPATGSLRRDYLRRLCQQTDTLALVSGGDPQRPVRLGKVYTPLLTTLPAKDPGERQQGRTAGLLDDANMPARDGQRLSAVAALDRWRHLVLLGGPGGGKSSFVHFVAQCLAGEALGDDAAAQAARLAQLTQPVPGADDDELPSRRRPGGDHGPRPPQPQPWRHGPLLPVLVVLRDLATQLPPPGTQVGAEQVLLYLQRGLQTAAQGRFADPLEAELRGDGALVMFDGLDEVPEAEQRRQQIQQVITDFAASFSQCRVLVTSRTYAYQQQHWKLPGFAEAPLADFNRAQIGAFVEAWYAHMVELLRTTPDDAQLRAAMLLRQVDNNPRVAELAQRPLLLTLFARLQAATGGDLPEHREALYHEAVKLLLDDWEGAKPRTRVDGKPVLEPSLSEWLNASRDDVRQQLNRLAFEAHRDQQNLEGTADIREDTLIIALRRASKNPDVRLDRLQEYLRDRAGILVEHGVGLLQFPHRSFQEYLAACHLANDDYPDQVANLAQTDPNRWREVLLLAAATAARGNRGLPTWGLVETLCPADLPAQPSPAQAWGALLAGQVLVASGQHQGKLAARDVPKRERVRQAQLRLLGLTGQTLPLAERARAGRHLAELGDPRPEVMTLEGMQFCWVPAGPFQMGSDKRLLSDDEKPQHPVDLREGYFMARFPMTVGQWRQYLADSRTRPGDADSLLSADNEPVARVSWYEAQQCCAWLTQRFTGALPAGWRVALPTEAQWEKAARGGDRVPKQPMVMDWEGVRVVAAAKPPVLLPNPLPGRDYPWGDDFDEDRCNASEAGIGQTSAIGASGLGASPYGCEEIAGNVWELTRTVGGKDYKLELRYPYDHEDKRHHDETAGAQFSRLLRGGSFNGVRNVVRCAYRNLVQPDLPIINSGFRVVLSAAPVL